jgi:hypothetical protein
MPERFLPTLRIEALGKAPGGFPFAITFLGELLEARLLVFIPALLLSSAIFRLVHIVLLAVARSKLVLTALKAS